MRRTLVAPGRVAVIHPPGRTRLPSTLTSSTESVAELDVERVKGLAVWTAWWWWNRRLTRPDSCCVGPLPARPAASFSNYFRPGEALPLEHGLLERAYMLRLTAPEMTALIGGMRALNANFGQSSHGVFTDRPEALSNDFFVNLLDMSTEWKTSDSAENVYEGRDRATGEVQLDGQSVDLVFGSHSELRALGGGLRVDDAGEKFVHDFVAAWNKVMNLDRFDRS